VNIFYLDKSVVKCAKYHCDKHVVKMILETAQLLCAAHWATGGTAPYKPTHMNHPCAIWARQSEANYIWLCMLGRELCSQYTRRYGKHHKTSEVLTWCADNRPNLPDLPFFEPPLAMPDEYKIANSAILSYRNYYNQAKSHFCTWKQGNIPDWFVRLQD
jgi:hypothetical protein